MARRPESKPEGTAAATQQEGNGAGGLQWPGTARAGMHGPVPAGACMQGGRDDGSQQHMGAAQDRSREGQRPAAWAHRGKKGRGLGPAAAWLAARKKTTGAVLI